MFFSFFPGNQWVMSIRIWSRIVDQRPPGARRSRPPSQKPCWVPCSLLPDNPFCPGLESLLHKVPLKVISTHLKLQQAPLPKKTITHTHRQQHQTHSLGEMGWEEQLSPHTHSLLFSHFRAGLAGSPYFLPYQNPSPNSIIWPTIDDLRVQ